MVIQCGQLEIDVAARRPLITVYLNHQPVTSDCTDPSGMNTGIPGRIQDPLGQLRFHGEQNSRLAFPKK
jgi:hypothetical protein